MKKAGLEWFRGLIICGVLFSVGSLIGCGGGAGNNNSVGGSTIYYRDADGDGFGDPAVTRTVASQPVGYVADNTDCDDADATIYPGAVEILDGKDNNCNGEVDEGISGQVPSINISNATVAEGDSGSRNLEFTVTLSSLSGTNITVDYATSDDSPISGSATSGDDYVSAAGTLTIPVGRVSGVISISVIGDTSVEPDETFRVVLRNPLGGTLGRSVAIGTILNDDSAAPVATVFVTDATIAEGDSGLTALSFNVNVSPPSDTEVTFNYATADGTASSGDDFVPASGTVTIPAGSSSANINVDVMGDMVLEGDEIVVLTLDNPIGAVLRKNQAIGVIINDDKDVPALPVIGFGNNKIYAYENSSSPIAFRVVVPVSNHDITVDYATNNLSAEAGSDYVAASGTVTIPAGTNSRIINIDILGDAIIEGDEIFSITLSNPVGAHLKNDSRTAIGVIRNDDSSTTLPMIDIYNASALEGDSGNRIMRFEARLSLGGSFTTIGRDVTVNYSTFDMTANSGNDYVGSSGVFTFPAGSVTASIPIELTGDLEQEGNEQFKIVLSNPSSGVLLGKSTAVGTIIDDDAPFVGRLNDTGVTSCSDSENDNLVCDVGGLSEQDATTGRDATYNDNGDGYAGFSFTKMDNAGRPLADQSAEYTETPWRCVKDNVTGLVWEVKTADGGLQDKNWTYSWYNSSGINDGGNPGFPNGGVCVDSINCDTEKYINAVNDIALCGFTDWRLPTVDELMGLRDDYRKYSIDTRYFPDYPLLYGYEYWVSSPVSFLDGDAWAIDFYYSRMNLTSKSGRLRIRLVRGR